MCDFCLGFSHNGKWLFDFFVGHPGHFWAGAAIFGVLYAIAYGSKTIFPKIQYWPLLANFLLWAFLGFSEHDCVVHKVDIRIDVVLLWPWFFFGTAAFVVVFVVGLAYAVWAAKDEDRREGLASSLPLELMRAVGHAKPEDRENTSASPSCGSSVQNLPSDDDPRH
jgi:hypothetical protein